MLWLAHTYLLLARRDEALQMFERAFAADPLSPLATDHKAWWGYVLHGDRQRLLDVTDEMERMWPNDPKVSWIRSNLVLIEGRALDWDRFVARVIEIDPADYQNHAWLSYDYARVAVFDAARYHARMCTKLHPEGAACAYSIASDPAVVVSPTCVFWRQRASAALARMCMPFVEHFRALWNQWYCQSSID